MSNQSSLHVPKFNTNVILTWSDDFKKIKVEYIPNSCYTEKELNDEVILIIEKMLQQSLKKT